MRSFLCIILSFPCFSSFAQEELKPNKRYYVGLKYNLNWGNYLAHSDEAYYPELYYKFVPFELTYTYLYSDKHSFNCGFMVGSYKDRWGDREHFQTTHYLWHTMNYVGIKPGFGVQL